MNKILILLCLVLGYQSVNAQRSYQFESPDRLYLEGKAFFELRDFPACMDKLEIYKGKSTNKDLIQEADYMLAFIAFEQGRENATEILEHFVDTYPDTRHRNEICFLLGSAHFAKQDYNMALYWLSESNIDLLGTEQQEAYAFRSAYALLQTGDLNASRAYFLRIQQAGSTYREAASYYVAYIDYASGDYDSAYKEFDRLKNSPLYKEQSLYYITQILFIQERYDKVITNGEELLRIYPNSDNNLEVHRLLGNAYYQQGDQTKALSMLSKYVDATDSPLRGDLYILGICYFNKKDYQNAIRCFSETVKETDALTQNAYLYLGQSYLSLNDKNNARMAFEMAATSTYDLKVQEVAMYNYALLIHETSFSGFGESVTIFEDFLNRFPDSEYADKVGDYLVEVYLTTKNYDAALASIEKIRQPSSKIIEAKQNVLFQLGTQSFTNQDIDKAIAYFNNAITLGNYYDRNVYSDAYFWRGESYYRQNNFSQAISDYQSYLNNTQDRSSEMYSLAYYNVGYCHFKQHNYNSALTAFRQYTSLERDNTAISLADAYNRIGDCQFYNREFAAAEQSYSKAASLQPSFGDYALYQKGYVLGLQKNYQGKIRILDQLIQEYPESQYIADALYEKGRAYVLLETYNMAENAFTQLMQKYPQNNLARKAGIQLGLLYFNSNQSEKAVAAYKKVINDYPGSEEAKIAVQDLRSVYIDLNDVASYAAYVNSLGGNVHIEINEQDSLTYLAAERLFLRGDNNGAQQSLKNYLSSFPQGAFHSNANYYLASIAFSQKNYTEAKQRYTSVINSGDTKFMEDSWARKAEIEYVEKDFTEAVKSFIQLEKIAGLKENREAAKLGIMRAAQHTGQQSEALRAADELLKDSKLSPEIETEARFLRAKTYIALNDKAKAETDLQTLSKDVRTVYGAEAKYLLAQIYFDRNESDKAENEVMDFIKKGTSHQYWLARGFILLADIYIKKGDDFQARQYLTSLQNNYKGNDDIPGMIEDRLSKLK
ncbi:MAG: tetratricopeptide repeat protein [Tannerella sp.]|jgi:TolA-binding protein|nr:tetratricopeptide repeat protein [Tannerella sp.]